MTAGSSVVEPARDIPVVRAADVVVCGAGPAGVSAALAAASSGANTVLIENAGCLGGVWTSGLLTYVLDPKEDSPVTRLIVSELEKRDGHSRRKKFDEANQFAWARHSFLYDAELMKGVLERECLRRGVHVRLYTRVCSVIKDAGDPRRISAIVTESKSGREAWSGKVFIDATGDGDVAAQAGCGFSVGRPETGETQPLTLMCLVGTPHPELVEPLSWMNGEALRRELAAAGAATSYGSPVLFAIRPDLFAFMMNHKYGSALDAEALSRATWEAREEILETVAALRRHGGPWEGLRVVATAAQIGVREGRRIKGRYEVTAEDLRTGCTHADAVCRVHFPVDVHSTRPGAQTSFDRENRISSRPYDIPLRALIAADADNLLMAGRNISGDFVAHSSYRVTGNSVVLGEAAGSLAATMVVTDRPASEITFARFRTSQNAIATALQIS